MSSQPRNRSMDSCSDPEKEAFDLEKEALAIHSDLEKEAFAIHSGEGDIAEVGSIDMVHPFPRRKCSLLVLLLTVGTACILGVAALVAVALNRGKGRFPTVSGDAPSVPVPSNLDVICDVSRVETEIGYRECSDACAGASACCLPGSLRSNDFDGSNDCGDWSVERCDAYASCLVLTAYNGGESSEETVGVRPADVHGTGRLPYPPSNLYSMCSPVRSQECIDVCAEAKCCVSSGSYDCSKFSPNCKLYLPCWQNIDDIFSSGGGGTIEKHSVAEACNPTNIAMEVGRQECLNICKDYKCCFPDDGEAGCRGILHEKCEAHEACELVFDVGEEYDDGASIDIGKEPSVAEACDPTNLATEMGRQLCLNICKEYDCCFPAYGEAGCRGILRDECNEHEACEAVFVDDISGDVGEEYDASSPFQDEEDESPLTVEYKVMNACAVDNIIESPQLLEKCRKVCAPGGCCFETANGKGCSSMCEQYTECEFLYSPYHDSAIGTPTSSLSKRPQQQHTQGNAEPIDFVYADGSTIPDPPSNLAALCSSGSSRCKEMCNLARCCKDNGGCLSNPADAKKCRAYFSCWENVGNGGIEATGEIASNIHIHSSVDVVPNEGENITTSTAVAQINLFCDRNSDSSELYLCKSACATGECCFASKSILSSSNRCTDTGQLNCSLYKKCSILYSGNKDGSNKPQGSVVDAVGQEYEDLDVFPDEVELDSFDLLKQLCARNTVFFDLDECKEICASGACCHAESNNSCSHEKKCEHYMDCAFLYDDGDNSLKGNENSVGKGTTTKTVAAAQSNVAGALEVGQEFEDVDSLSPDFDMNGDIMEDEGEWIFSTISKMCGQDLSDVKKLNECRNVCHPGECCFRTGNASCSKETMCQHYVMCSVLYVEGGEDDVTSGGSPDMENSPPDSAESTTSTGGDSGTLAVSTEVDAINNVCASNRLESPVGREECKMLCAEGACCFARGSFNCRNELTDWCSHFDACKGLL